MSEELKNFQVWLRTVCFQKPTPEAYDLAKSAWQQQSEKINEFYAAIREMDEILTAVWSPAWLRTKEKTLDGHPDLGKVVGEAWESLEGKE